jgi:long-chain acyl-CoA synthetase
MPQADTLPQLLLQRALASPLGLAQRHKDRGIWRESSWTDVLTNVREFGLGLLELGLLPSNTVAIIGENEPEQFWAEYAVQAMRGKTVSIYPDSTADEMRYLVEDSETVLIVAQDQEQVDKAITVLEHVPSLLAVIYWDDKGMWSYKHPKLHSFEAVLALGRQRESERPGEFEASVRSGKADDIALLSYTSGTTGRPKGVIFTHRFLFDNAERLRRAVSLKSGMRYLSYLSPAWSTEQILTSTLGLTLPLVVHFPESPEEVLPNIRELAVELMFFSPRQWESLASLVQARMLDVGPIRRAFYQWGLAMGHRFNVARLEGRPIPWWARLLYWPADIFVLRALRDNLGLTDLQAALCGGSSMAPDVFRMFHAMGVPLRNIYGSTEMGFYTCHQGSTFNLETVGNWMACDPRFGPSLEWQVTEEGELLVKGGSGFKGYYRKPEESQERFSGEWYRTGDAVSVAENGELVFLERLKDLRQLRPGHKYPPQYIETRLRFSPFVREIMTVGGKRHDFVTALVNIDSEVVGRWAEERNIAFSTFTDLSQKREVLEIVRQEIVHINELLPPNSRVHRFANFPKELDPDEGELTRTRKLRREFLERRYAALIEGLYDAAARTVDCEIPVTYQDGRQGVLRARVALTDVNAAGDKAVSRLDVGYAPETRVRKVL